MRRLISGLLLGLYSISTASVIPIPHFRPESADSKFHGSERIRLLQARGLTTSTLDEVGPPASAPASGASTPRQPGSRSSSRSGAGPSRPRRTKNDANRSTRSTDGHTGQQTIASSLAQAREQVKAKAKLPIEPLPQNIAAAVNRMPRPTDDGLSNMPNSPTAVAMAARRVARLRAAGLIGSTSQSTPRVLTRHQFLSSNVLDSPVGTPQSSPRTPALSIATSDTPDRSQPASPARSTGSQRSSFAFGEAPVRPGTRRNDQSGIELQPMGSTPRMPPAPNTARAGQPNHQQSTLSNAPSMPQNNVQNSNALSTINTASAGDTLQTGLQRSSSSSVAPTPRWRSMAHGVARNTGLLNAAGNLDRVGMRVAAGTVGGIALAGTGLGLTAATFPGHLALGGVLGGAGLVQMLGAHIDSRVNGQRDPMASQHTVPEQPQQGTNPSRGVLQTIAAPIRSAGRDIARQFRSMSSVPTDQETMDRLQRRSEYYNASQDVW